MASPLAWLRRLFTSALRDARPLDADEDERALEARERAAENEAELERVRATTEPLRRAIEARDYAHAGALLEAAVASGNVGVALEVLVPNLRDALSKAQFEHDLPFEMLCARAATLLDERGGRARAIELLAHARSAAPLMVLSDLLSSPDTNGTPPDRHALERALDACLRALEIDVDAPGARRRFATLRSNLGFDDQTPRPLREGATLLATNVSHRFLLRREVARGGAGIVYEATETLDVGCTRTVALKIAHDHDDRRAQLVHEARVAVALAAALRDVARGGIVRVLDLDREQALLSMVWLAGGSLRDRLAAPTDVERAPERCVSWLLDLASTLAAMHAAGWVHGDVKPANVMISAEGDALIGDFGTTRRGGAIAVPGSRGFVSPERARGDTVHPHDDVYAFGATVAAVADVTKGPLRIALHALARTCLRDAQDRPNDGEALLALLRSVRAAPTRLRGSA